MLAAAIVCASTTYVGGGLGAPTFDRWVYPFNASPGSRSVGSTFSSYGSEYDFDDRDGQVLLGWATADLIEAGWPAHAYTVHSCTLTIAIASDDVVYDASADPRETHEPDGPADADPGRPTLLSGVGFRNGWDGWAFGDDGPFGDSMTSGTRNCFAIDFDASGTMRDISNSLTEGFEPAAFAIGQSEVAAPGDLLPQYSELKFTVDVSDPAIQCYLRTGLADGLVEFIVTSLHPASEPGSDETGIWPDWILSENALVGLGLVNAATLTLDASLTEPSGVPGDVNGDGVVGIDDLLDVLASFGPCPCCPTDLNGDGAVTVDDLLTLIGAWG